MTLFISEQTLKDRTGMSAAINGMNMFPLIKVAQDTFLMPALGSTLYKRLLKGVEDNDLNAAETTLINDYVTDCLIWATMAKLVVPMGFQLFSKGFLQKTADNSVNPSFSDMNRIEQHYQDMAEDYRQKIVNYLKQNYSLFAEYAEPGNGWDVVRPISQAYECPIYLDEPIMQHPVDSTVLDYSRPKAVSYFAVGGETSFTINVLAGKSILIASRSGAVKAVKSTSVTDTNDLQVVGAVVTLPTGDIAINGEHFRFIYI
jgi:uncharacterized protein YbdZ (MbtH family)